MADFKVGDLVQLKSGGPSMTVAARHRNGDLGCAWFDGNEKVQKEDFPPEALRPCTPMTEAEILGERG